MTVRAHVVVGGTLAEVDALHPSAHEARALGLAGWVRNAGDDVEAVFEGPRPSVERIVGWCHTGPAHARVEHVEVEWGEPEGLTGFGIRY
jgi:acylphosphatase